MFNSKLNYLFFYKKLCIIFMLDLKIYAYLEIFAPKLPISTNGIYKSLGLSPP
jgi:hypothetical protein